MGATTFRLDEMQKKLVDLASEGERREILSKLGFIAEAEVKKNTPVDKGRLRSSINTQVVSDNKAIVGTNVDYAEAVENGHVQHKRFLPAQYLDSVKGSQYLGDNQKGIMLKEKFIQGAHMFSKGFQSARPKMRRALNKWLTDLSARFNQT